MSYYKASEAKQLDILLKNTRTGLVYAALYIVLFYLIIPKETLNFIFYIWAVSYIFINVIRTFLGIKISDVIEKNTELKPWVIGFNVNLFLSSICLCYLLLIFETTWPVVNQIAFWMLYVSLIAGSVPLYSVKFESYLSFASPLIVSCFLMPFTLTDPSYKYIGYLFIPFGIGIIFVAKKYNDILKNLNKKEIELAESNKKLESIASKDPLTRLPNRRAYDEYFLSEWDRHKRSASVLSLLIIDVDHFKEYNDHYGHSEGDTCLIRLSNIINKNLKRPGDLACRYGGEEFTIILPDTNTKGAFEVAERMRKKIENLQIPHEYSEMTPYVTVSIGVATIDPSDENEPQSFFKQADAQLYNAKQRGRNKVCIDTKNIVESNTT